MALASPTSVASPPRKAPVAKPTVPPRPRFRFGGWIRGSLGALVSMLVHLIAILSLAMIVTEAQLPQQLHEIVAEVLTPEERPEDLRKLELDEQLELVQQRTQMVFSAGVVGEIAAAGPAGAIVSTPTMDEALVEQFTAPDVQVAGVLEIHPPVKQIIQEIPDGQIGAARAIVDNYDQALDQITQEVLWMTDRGPVLLIWVFDQSESMKDDQKEIRTRIDHVYDQLGLVGKNLEQKLATAVTSYGENFAVHTPKPATNRYDIRAAIDQVPVDPSGKEMMCQAVAKTLNLFRPYSQRTGRQTALVLVTDESGDRNDNDRFLEQAVAEAKASKSRVYVIGREAVFGYPYAHINWIHPQTKHHHWIQIDRGPETAFVEQLQTDGFHRRRDAHPSGYGPYEQTRLARESGGIFFLLPSLEKDLVHGDKKRYELEAMRPYLPDLRPRAELADERDDSPLKSTLTKIIYDLNPYDPVAAKIIEMRVHFAPDLPTLAQQARQEQAKAIIYLQYLARAEEAAEKIRPLREREPNPRWQANYDLLYAQLVAYQARVYEYGSRLEVFLRDPKIVPRTKEPNLTHVRWDIGVHPKLLDEKKSGPYVARAKQLFAEVIEKHPGTPYAARAEIELRRGFGVNLHEVYHPPAPSLPPGTPLLPVPKL